MCEDEGTRGGDGTSEVVRFVIVGKGRYGCASGSSGGTVDGNVVGGDENLGGGREEVG